MLTMPTAACICTTRDEIVRLNIYRLTIYAHAFPSNKGQSANSSIKRGSLVTGSTTVLSLQEHIKA